MQNYAYKFVVGLSGNKYNPDIEALFKASKCKEARSF